MEIFLFLSFLVVALLILNNCEKRLNILIEQDKITKKEKAINIIKQNIEEYVEESHVWMLAYTGNHA